MPDILVREDNVVQRYVDQGDGTHAKKLAVSVQSVTTPLDWAGYPGLETSDFPLPITAPNPIQITTSTPLPITAPIAIPITASSPIQITTSVPLPITAPSPISVNIPTTNIININFRYTSQQTIAITTNSSDGTQFVTFPGLAINGNFEIFNYTGIDLEFRTNADTVFLAIPQNTGRLFPGISNANQVSVRRRDLTNSPVVVKAIVYTV